MDDEGGGEVISAELEEVGGVRNAITESKSPEEPNVAATPNGHVSSNEKTAPVDSVPFKIFLGCIAKHITEYEIYSLCEEFGKIEEAVVLKNHFTGISRGCAFVTFSRREDAEKAIESLDGKLVFPSAKIPVVAKCADGEIEKMENKLFIGMIPKDMNEDKLKEIFEEYGDIEEIIVIRQNGVSRGCAFLRYAKRISCTNAIKSLNGIKRIKTMPSPLVVRYADTNKQRERRMRQKMWKQLSSQGMYGNMQYDPQTPPQMQPRLQTQQQGYTHDSPPYQPIPQYSTNYLTYEYYYTNAPQQRESQFDARSKYMVYESPVLSQMEQMKIGHDSTLKIEGPPGCNLFVMFLPHFVHDVDLYNLFSSFGRIVSSKVFIDRATGRSKGFGFVSYDNPRSAEMAIQQMNGYEISGKRLKVQLKSSRRETPAKDLSDSIG